MGARKKACGASGQSPISRGIPAIRSLQPILLDGPEGARQDQGDEYWTARKIAKQYLILRKAEGLSRRMGCLLPSMPPILRDGPDGPPQDEGECMALPVDFPPAPSSCWGGPGQACTACPEDCPNAPSFQTSAAPAARRSGIQRISANEVSSQAEGEADARSAKYVWIPDRRAALAALVRNDGRGMERQRGK